MMELDGGLQYLIPSRNDASIVAQRSGTRPYSGPVQTAGTAGTRATLAGNQRINQHR